MNPSTADLLTWWNSYYNLNDLVRIAVAVAVVAACSMAVAWRQFALGAVWSVYVGWTVYIVWLLSRAPHWSYIAVQSQVNREAAVALLCLLALGVGAARSASARPKS